MKQDSDDGLVDIEKLKHEVYRQLTFKLISDYKAFCHKQETPRSFTKTEEEFINSSKL